MGEERERRRELLEEEKREYYKEKENLELEESKKFSKFI
jgi:hypothetical protein